MGRPRAVLLAVGLLIALGLIPARSDTTSPSTHDWPGTELLAPAAGREVTWQRRPVSGAVGTYGRTLLLHRVRIERSDGTVARTLGYRMYDATGSFVRESRLAPSLPYVMDGGSVTSSARGFVITRYGGPGFHVSLGGAERVLWGSAHPTAQGHRFPAQDEPGPTDGLRFRAGAVSADGGTTWIELDDRP